MYLLLCYPYPLKSLKKSNFQITILSDYLLSLPNYNDMRLCIMIQMKTTGIWHSQSMNTPSATTTKNVFFVPMKPEPFPVYHTHRGTIIYII